MKKIIILVLSWCSLSLACPDLTGSYLCEKNSFRKDTIYSFSRMATTEREWAYSISAQPVNEGIASSYEFIADGIKRDVVDKITGQRLQVQAECRDTALQVSGTTQLPNGITIRFSELLSLNADQDLFNQSLDIDGNLVKETCLSLNKN